MAAKIVCVVGPTACGKTTLGVLLAKKFNGEVVSADSMQIYRGMTVGTAAPTAAEMDGVPHHMIAVADPAEPWSAARYAREAIAVVDDILSRGKLPILAGGTGLWLDAVVRGRDFAPGAAAARCGAAQERLEREGITPLLEELRRVDPETAARLHPADEKRILRALEVYAETGETISAHNARTAAMPPRYDAVWIGLQFADRADMRALIDRRVDAMAEAGLLEEVRALVRSGVPREATALRPTATRSCWTWGRTDRAWRIALVGSSSVPAVRQSQLTWLRRNPDIHWNPWGKERDFARALQVSTEILAAAGVF
jgi:tRNA dimethylallyltransferase